jgi:hypothetical protein
MCLIYVLYLCFDNYIKKITILAGINRFFGELYISVVNSAVQNKKYPQQVY